MCESADKSANYRLPRPHYLILVGSLALTININQLILPIRFCSIIVIQTKVPFRGAPMVFTLPLDETQFDRAAGNMIRKNGGEALTEADDRAKTSKSEGFDSFARTWENIR